MVPVNNTLVCLTSSFVFLAADTLLCVLMYIKPEDVSLCMVDQRGKAGSCIPDKWYTNWYALYYSPQLLSIMQNFVLITPQTSVTIVCSIQPTRLLVLLLWQWRCYITLVTYPKPSSFRYTYCICSNFQITLLTKNSKNWEHFWKIKICNWQMWCSYLLK